MNHLSRLPQLGNEIIAETACYTDNYNGLSIIFHCVPSIGFFGLALSFFRSPSEYCFLMDQDPGSSRCQISHCRNRRTCRRCLNVPPSWPSSSFPPLSQWGYCNRSSFQAASGWAERQSRKGSSPRCFLFYEHSIQTGSAQPHIYPSHIMALPIGDLDCEKVSRYTEGVTPLFSMSAKKYKENKELSSLRDYLLRT